MNISTYNTYMDCQLDYNCYLSYLLTELRIEKVKDEKRRRQPVRYQQLEYTKYKKKRKIQKIQKISIKTSYAIQRVIASDPDKPFKQARVALIEKRSVKIEKNLTK